MKKIIFLVSVLLFAFVQVEAQNNSESSRIVSAVAAKLGSMSAFGGNLTLTVESMSTKGTFVVMKDSYKIILDEAGMYSGIEAFSDGKAKYEVNHGSEEVVISGINPTDNDMLTNPAKAFYFPESMFNYAYKGTIVVNGKKCDIVDLTPKSKGLDIMMITLWVDKATSLPVSLRYKAEGINDIVVSIDEISEKSNISQSDFRFNKADFKGYEIIDFR